MQSFYKLWVLDVYICRALIKSVQMTGKLCMPFIETEMCSLTLPDNFANACISLGPLSLFFDFHGAFSTGADQNAMGQDWIDQ